MRQRVAAENISNHTSWQARRDQRRLQQTPYVPSPMRLIFSKSVTASTTGSTGSEVLGLPDLEATL